MPSIIKIPCMVFGYGFVISICLALLIVVMLKILDKISKDNSSK